MTFLIENNQKEGHYYQTSVGECPSSTTILRLLDKPALRGWYLKVALEYAQEELQRCLKAGSLTKESIAQILADAKKQPNKVRDAAGVKGSKFHNILEIYSKELKESEVPEDIRPLYASFMKFKQDYRLEIVKREHSVENSIERYAGTLDWEGWVSKSIGSDEMLYTLGDYKTSKTIYYEMIMQLASYWKCTPDSKVQQLGIFRPINEKCYEWRVVTLEEAEKAYKCFQHLVRFYWERETVKI